MPRTPTLNRIPNTNRRNGWSPRDLPCARFIARAPEVGTTNRVTLSGSNILTLSNDLGGIAGPMSSSPGAYCTFDTSIPLGKYGAIRTVSTSSDLKVLYGGPTGTNPFHLICLAKPISQTGAAQGGSGKFMLSGDPGNDANHKNSGIGNVSVLNGVWTEIGGYQNPIAAGGNLPRAIFDTNTHIFEAVNDGSQLIMKQDGGRLGLVSGGSTLSSGQMGFHGAYPLPLYGPPDTMIYWAGWFDRVLTDTEMALLCNYINTEFTFIPKRYIQVIGDSITAGHISGANTTSYIEQMVLQYAALPIPEKIYYNNTGISSQTTTQILARVTPTYMLDFSPPLFREQWFVIGGRTNDVISPAASYANLASINTIAHTAGIKTCIITVIPGASMNAQQIADYNAFNGLVLANSAGFDKVANLSPIFPTVPTTTFYLPDNIHPTNAVISSMATIIRQAIDS
jgi:hypothetical protein